MLAVVVQILTAVTLLIGLGIFAGKLFSKLNTLLTLPASVKRIEEDLRHNTAETRRVAEAAQEWRTESETWHHSHLRNDHKRRL